MKTPGVYIVEKNAFPNSIVEIATAVPAFIGYTEKALNGKYSLRNKPCRITSLTEFQAYFGEASRARFSLNEASPCESGIRLGGGKYALRCEDPFLLYRQMQLFFANGGGPCYVVSVGDYGDQPDQETLEAGIASLLKEQEPTLLVIPEAVSLPRAEDCYALQRAMLRHCGSDTGNRFAILDVYDGAKGQQDPAGNCVEAFRTGIGTEWLSYGAAYYPWLDTSVVAERELSFANLDTHRLKAILTEEAAGQSWPEQQKRQWQAQVDRLGSAMDETAAGDLHQTLLFLSPLYTELIREMRRQLNLLPPSAALAGVYTRVDNTRGVWKAPANVGVALAVSPAVDVTPHEQEELNMPLSGKAVNAIRTFVGEGIKVWGARTLDGNSLDWRYINVRRTMIMLEGSIRNATAAYVFDPNTASTWINIKSCLCNFLMGIWKRGGLAGSMPEEAYSVHVGLGETMTPEDILEGILRVTVLVAIVRPGEFLEITFDQQMQKS